MARQSEPSMEEILASIKRVIAEEKEFRAMPSASEEDEEVLELDETMVEMAAEPLVDFDPGPPLMAEEKAAPSRARFEQLVDVAAADPEAAAGNPLEEMVREMLRPMLKAWLDEKLPGIVDEHVRREISRITGRKL